MRNTLARAPALSIAKGKRWVRKRKNSPAPACPDLVGEVRHTSSRRPAGFSVVGVCVSAADGWRAGGLRGFGFVAGAGVRSEDDALAHGAILAEKDRVRSERRGLEAVAAVFVGRRGDPLDEVVW